MNSSKWRKNSLLEFNFTDFPYSMVFPGLEQCRWARDSTPTLVLCTCSRAATHCDRHRNKNQHVTADHNSGNERFVCGYRRKKNKDMRSDKRISIDPPSCCERWARDIRERRASGELERWGQTVFAKLARTIRRMRHSSAVCFSRENSSVSITTTNGSIDKCVGDGIRRESMLLGETISSSYRCSEGFDPFLEEENYAPRSQKCSNFLLRKLKKFSGKNFFPWAESKLWVNVCQGLDYQTLPWRNNSLRSPSG